MVGPHEHEGEIRFASHWLIRFEIWTPGIQVHHLDSPEQVTIHI